MTQAANDSRENPTNPSLFHKPTRQEKAKPTGLDNKAAFINKDITLAIYLNAKAANIDYIDYLDDDDGLDNVLNPLNFEVDHPLGYEKF